VTLIAEKAAKGSRGRRFGADPGRSLGEHPDKGGPILLKKGRYGPYVSHDGLNATLRRDQEPDTVTLADAVALLAERAERVGATPARRRAPARKKQAAASSEAAPKSSKRKPPSGASKKSSGAKSAVKRAPKAKAAE
jgi:DNA topoisomerase-1